MTLSQSKHTTGGSFESSTLSTSTPENVLPRLEKTGNKLALQGQLGHSSSRQTDHYAKITETVIKSGIKAYDQKLRGSNVVDLFSDENESEKQGVLVEKNLLRS